MPSIEAFTTDEQDRLLRLALDSIQYRLAHGRLLLFRIDEFSPRLQQVAACFITLTRNGQLRGCIGSLIPHRTLVEDVAANACAAAFDDPRFPALSNDELEDLDISISVLTPARAMSFTSEQDLLRQLQPHVDGLILSDGYRRSTFLPSVWESLPNRRDFLQHLKIKAGFTPDYWSSSIKVERYTTVSFHKRVREMN